MTLKEGGIDPKQNPSPASLTSLLISAQISTHFLAVLESPFSPTHRKLLTHIEATVIQPQLQIGPAVAKQLFCKRQALENLVQPLLDVAAVATLLCPPPEMRLPAAQLARACITPLLYMGLAGFSQGKCIFYKKGTEFQPLR